MIKKLLYLIVFMIALTTVSQTIVLGSCLIGKSKEGSDLAKNILYSIVPYIYTYGLGSVIKYNGEYKSTNKVDIVITNHTTALDFAIYISLIRLFDHRNIYFIMKKSVMFVPGGGFILTPSSDIKLNRKLEDDQDNIINTIKQINDGIIILLPEGTRYSPSKHADAIKYSTDNNLPIFNNTLYPKMKGLWLICNVLNDTNKLGNIIDITYEIDKFKNKQISTLDLIKNKLGDTKCIITSYTVPINNITDYVRFKAWFLTVWIQKDNYLDDMNKYKYKDLVPEMKSYDYMILIIIGTLFIYLTTHTNGLFIPISFALSYAITIITSIRFNK